MVGREFIMKTMLSLSMCGITIGIFAQQNRNSAAQVKEVTIFTNGADVSNQVSVNLPKGSCNLLIQNVARDIDINSIQISGLDGMTVLSVSATQDGEVEIFNPIHQKLKDSLDLITGRKDILVNKQNAAQGALKILNNDQLLGSGGKVDLNDLTKLVDYYQLKSVELNTSIAALKKQIEAEDKIINRLQAQIRVYTGSGGNILVQMNNSKPIVGNLTISYMTYAANWQAYYDLRAKSISSPIEIVYKARVTQYTGVDWKNVKLILSTGNPSQSGTAPTLSPSYARFMNPMVTNVSAQNSLQGKASGVRLKQADAVFSEVAMNQAAVPVLNVVDNQLSVTFDIETPYDILSNGQAHSVTLKELTHPASFNYYAVPKLDKDVFLLAEISDFEKLNLVPGEANIIFENMFVGSSFLNTNVTTDTLSLGMGRDKAITVKRDRIMDAKSSQTSGGSKRQVYTYEIRVKNNKSSAVDIILKDQYPVSTDKSIEIELTNDGGALVDKETGILTWKIDVKPGETKTYRFTYTVKYPKDRVVNFN